MDDSFDRLTTLPMRLDARLVQLAAELTADNPMPPPRVVERFGSPEEQVLQCMRSTVRADEDAGEAEMLATCEYVGRTRAAQLASLYGLWRHGVGGR